jgi:hypothetical protein
MTEQDPHPENPAKSNMIPPVAAQTGRLQAGNEKTHTPDLESASLPPNPHAACPWDEEKVAESQQLAEIRDREFHDFMERRAAGDPALAESFPETNPEDPTPEFTVSELQLAANRANAKLSTGPTSPTGKAKSARNNFRHGLTQNEGDIILLETESQDDYNEALLAFLDEWKPATATERDLVERLAGRQWLRRRAMKLQKLHLNPVTGEINDIASFGIYRRYEVSHERAYNKALADLIRLRSLRLREQIGFESQRRKNEEHIYKINTLKHREKLQQYAVRTAEARTLYAEERLNRLLNSNTGK